MKASMYFLLAAVAFVLSGEARSQQVLSAAELEAVMVGNTVRFHNLVTSWRAMVYFDSDGTALVGDEHILLSGTWRINADGTHCVAVGGRQSCARVQSNGDGTYAIGSGKPAMTWLEVIKGRSPSGFAAIRSEGVSFPSVTFLGELFSPFMPPAEEGKPTTISGILTVPPGEARIPAVVIMHGCGGVSPPAQYLWAGALNKLGAATLIVDSFRNRNVREVCTGSQPINVASVIADAYHALDFIAAHPRIDPSRIAILGASFGGRTALWTSNDRLRQRYSKSATRFAAHLALYPACYVTLSDETNITGAPIRIFHPAADDWTPIGACKAYVERLRQAGKDAVLLEYAGARHGFDIVRSPAVRVFPEARNPTNCSLVEKDGRVIDQATGSEWNLGATCFSRGASVGYDAPAHRKVVDDVQGFIKTLFRLN